MGKAKQLLSSARRWLPRRRRRFWRYVSPHRRGVGLLVLALLLAVVYAYWFATNDRRVRNLAKEYLSEVTGGVVRIERASFSMFGPVELKGVSVYVPGDDSPEPFLSASTVLLRHRPWGLFVNGRLVPTEIVCMSPVVTLEHDVRTNSYNASQLIAAARRPEASPGDSMASFRIRDGRLRVVERDGRLRQTVSETAVEMSIVPTAEKTYEIRFEQRPGGAAEATRGTVELDASTGEVRSISGVVPIPTLEKALPRKYAQLRARYDIGGEIRLTGGQRLGPDARVVRAELHDVSLRLPEEEGGLEIAQVSGELVFDLDADTVRLERITGRLPQAGGATVAIDGSYGGYEPDSPFAIRLQLRNATLPEPDEVSGILSDALAEIQQNYSPQGRMDLGLTVSRTQDGPLEVSGRASPDGMSIKLRSLPYRLEGLRGAVVFDSRQARLEKLQARHGDAELELSGVVKGGLNRGSYDIQGRALDIQLDEKFREALFERFDRVWQELSPSGDISVEFRVVKTGPEQPARVDATVLLDGDCGMTYRGFPYPLEGLYGTVHVSGDNVRIDSVRGRQGPMSCVIDGRIEGLYSGSAEAFISVEAASVPLDDVLLGSLNERSRNMLESLHASGVAENVSARVHKPPGEPTEFTILARLGDAEFRPDVFPYRISQAEGVVTIRRDRVVIESISARRGEADIQLSGQVHIDRDPVMVDLDIGAKKLVLDEELYSALPESVRRVWDDFSPSGTADADLTLRTGSEQNDGGTDYRLELTPLDMRVTYARFPQPFRAIEGTVVATPGRIELRDVMGKDEEASMYLDGEVVTTDGAHSAELTVRARRAAITEKLLASVPAGLAPLAEKFQPGGTCDVDLSKLRFEIPTEVATTTAAAEQPPVLWRGEGWVAFDAAVADLGFGHKTLSGKVTGSAGRAAEGLEIDAQVALDSVLVGRGKMTDVTGHLVKTPGSSRMRINDLLGKVYQGRLYGLAEIELSDPLEYALSFSVEDVKLEGLVTAGRDPSAEERPGDSEISGLLTGKLEYRATAGDGDSQQAAGRFRIKDGKLYRLPVPLEMLYVITLTLPGDAAFTSGDVQYELHGHELTFREIHLRGPAVSVVGSGQLNLQTEQLRLNFITGPPGKVPRLAAELDEVLKPIARELAEIRISGTLSNPGPPRTVTLGSLQDAINRLLNPETPAEP